MVFGNNMSTDHFTQSTAQPSTTVCKMWNKPHIVFSQRGNSNIEFFETPCLFVYRGRRVAPPILVTLTQLKAICTRMSEFLPGERFGVDDCSEGGIAFMPPAAWDDATLNKIGWYKTIRFRHPSRIWSMDNRMEPTRQFAVNHHDRMGVALKSFHAAQPITGRDVQAYCIAFLEIVGLPPGWDAWDPRDDEDEDDERSG